MCPNGPDIYDSSFSNNSSKKHENVDQNKNIAEMLLETKFGKNDHNLTLQGQETE